MRTEGSCAGPDHVEDSPANDSVRILKPRGKNAHRTRRNVTAHWIDAHTRRQKIVPLGGRLCSKDRLYVRRCSELSQTGSETGFRGYAVCDRRVRKHWNGLA